MIDILGLDDDILKITVSGKLDKDDFRKIAPTVDQLLNMRGSLKLLIDATSFDGWSDMQATTSHFAFVRDHHQKIERIALIAGHAWQHWMVGMMAVFVHPEIRIFNPGQSPQAEAWLQGVDSNP